jgi:hypothetical protein
MIPVGNMVYTLIFSIPFGIVVSFLSIFLESRYGNPYYLNKRSYIQANKKRNKLIK